PYSYAGGIITSRLGDDGSYNLVYGLDSIFRVKGDRYLTLKWSQTLDDEVIRPGHFDFLKTGLFYVQWENRTRRGLGYNVRFVRMGADFEPEMGFVRRTNVTALSGWVRYGIFPAETSATNWMTPGLFGSAFVRNDDGTVESAMVNVWFYSEQKSGATINPWANINYEDLREPLSLPEDTEVPAGPYTFYTVNGGYEMPTGRLLRANLNGGIGTFYDGWRVWFNLTPTWNLSRYLELGGSYELNRIRFPDRDQGFDAHVFRIRAQVALNTKVSANAFVQYNSAANLVSTNVRFRYNFAEGNDLWIVYNEGLNTDRYRDTPVLPLTNDRTVLLKYTHTFQW
ncbi:MAG: hypothetical protein ACE5G0_20415, partial [Rhodothermales bacterium]